jgi:hypothetical protein
VNLEVGGVAPVLPTGFMPFGAAGLGKFTNAVDVACGTLQGCNDDSAGLAYSFGATYWFSQFFGAEGSYVRPTDMTATGGGENFEFTSFLDAYFITAAAKGGIPAGPLRVYGQFGANYHRATFSTTQTMEDVTVTIDDIPQVIEGGTQTFELKTAGWGWQFGGGIEGWVTSRFAIYGEGGRAALKGNELDDGEGIINERVTFFLIGAKVRLGG